MNKHYFISTILIGWFACAQWAQAAENCIIEGDHIKVSARIWADTVDNGNDWMAQLDKPLCVLGVNPSNQTTYKVSNTVILVKLTPEDGKTRKVLDTAEYTRAELDGVMVTSHDKNERIQCSIAVSAVKEAKAGHLVSELVRRGDTKLPWSLKAKNALQIMFANQQAVDAIGKNALEFVHPLNNYQGVTDWSARDRGANLVLSMRIAWKGKILNKVYYTDVEWVTSSAGHVNASLIGDDGKIPVTDGKVEKMDGYFRDQVWPSLRNNIQ